MNTDSLNGMYTNLVVPHGTNLRSLSLLPSTALSPALTQTVAFLRRIEGAATLYRYEDWWEHDGMHLTHRDESIDFDILCRLVETPDTLNGAMPGDDDVFVGIAPSDFHWYLRFYMDSEWMVEAAKRHGAVDAFAVGRFDITLPDSLVDVYRQQVTNPLTIEMQAQESIAYYLSIGMGSYQFSRAEEQKMREAVQQELKNLMSAISERCHHAGWMDETEFVLWKAVTEGPIKWGQDTISEGDIAALKQLAQHAGGWIVWDEATEETFFSMSQWKQLYSSHDAGSKGV